MPPTLHPLLLQAGLAFPLACQTGRSAASAPIRGGSALAPLFIGLPGGQVDGGQLLAQGLEAGAVAAVIGVEAAAAQPPSRAIQCWCWKGHWPPGPDGWRPRSGQNPSQKLALIGVTGTNGKTTTTHLIEHLAAAAGQTTALFGTLVNRWPGHRATASHTTAFADLLQGQLAEAVAAGSALAAMEVSSHALDQGRVAGCHFAGAVFTKPEPGPPRLPPVDAGLFRAKALLFAEPLLAGCAVVNIDDPWGRNGGPPGRQPRRAPLAQLPQRSRRRAADGGAELQCRWGQRQAAYAAGPWPVPITPGGAAST